MNILEPIYNQGFEPSYLLMLFDLVYAENFNRIKVYFPKLKDKNVLKRTSFYRTDTNKSIVVPCSLLFKALEYGLHRTSKTKIKKIIKYLIQNGCEPRVGNPQLLQADFLFKIYELYANILDEINMEDRIK